MCCAPQDGIRPSLTIDHVRLMTVSYLNDALSSGQRAPPGYTYLRKLAFLGHPYDTMQLGTHPAFSFKRQSLDNESVRKPTKGIPLFKSHQRVPTF